MSDPPASPDNAPAGLALFLVPVAIAAIALPALIVVSTPPLVSHPRARLTPHRVVPKAELPRVEPMAFEDLDPAEARAFNAAVPFATGPNPAARPFRFVGTDEQRARATDCLAAGVLYEAGDDPEGQQAVAQVVINRARHPAFPKTICGVVFQGSERPTGCQFTFTCDGTLLRHHWSDAAWDRARSIAAAALAGNVYKRVGYATHYHTDWVVPYWQSSLDKIAAVHTHLFFRWTGWWGTPPAFNRHISPDEPVITELAAYSEAHKGGDELAAAATDAAEIAALEATLSPSLPNDANSFLLTLDPRMPPEAYALLATRTCADRPYCKVMGWTNKAKTPSELPLKPAQIATMSFSYLRDRSTGFDKALWNCAEFKRVDLSQCMKLQVLVPTSRQADDFKLESLPGTTNIPRLPVAAALRPDEAAPGARKPDVPALPGPKITGPEGR